ncbi:phosphatase PAP2 family protein [Muricauda sp. JGD-17]|uniref:Phosphatase PAP2 family protein n=1 Tax=Flagellimonas ochracea TaxID=2696472 RepID=A0A964TCT6_9FLAO|nr:phosphatase PAP2 family protein [Allomuricauda ochracea]NAY92477.1 phosphatase PAP2 family protein [Allomuricauda ochracea]
MWKKLLEWDRDMFIYLNNLGIETYDMFWSIVTNIYTWIPLFILFIVVIYLKFPQREATYKVLTVLGLLVFILALTHFTKLSVARLRPNNSEEINTLIRILHTPVDYSFFSGHASSSFSLTLLVYLFLRKKAAWALVFFIWPVLFALSRIYVGVHYPSDLIMGALVGVCSAVVFYKLHNRVILPYSKSARP